MTPLSKRRIVVITILVLLLPLVFTVWVSIINVGILVVERSDQTSPIKSIAYNKTEDPSDPKTTEDTSITLPSGDYDIQVTLQDNSRYYRQVSVPSFRKQISIQPSSFEHELEAIGKETFPFILAANNSDVISYNQAHDLKKVPRDKISPLDAKVSVDPNLSSLLNPISLSNGTVVGLNATGANVYIPTLYSAITEMAFAYRAYDYSGSKYGTQIFRAGPGFAVFDGDTRTVNFFGTDLSSKEPFASVSLTNYTLTDSSSLPIMTTGKGSVAFVTGEREVDEGLSVGAIKNAEVHVLSKDGAVIGVVKIEGDTAVSRLSLSDDGSYIVVGSPQSTRFYSVSTRKPVLTIPLTFTEHVWDGDNFVFSSPNAGIFVASMKNRDTSNILPDITLNISSIGFIDDGKLYFSAFSELNTNTSFPDAYSVSLTDPADDSNILAKSLPIWSGDYSIDYIGDKIIVTSVQYIVDGVVVNNEGELAAKEMLNTVLPDQKNYRIEYAHTPFDVSD